MNTYQTIFDANQALTEDEIVLAIYTGSDGELTVKEAQSEFYAMAVAAGLIMTPSDKKNLWLEKAADLDMSTAEDVDTAKSIGAELEIGVTTVVKYIKAKAVKDDVEPNIPQAAVRGESKSGKLVDWFIDNQEATRNEIVAAGLANGLSETSAKYYVNVFKLVRDIMVRIS